jgi:taurine dioxygenase
MRRRKPCEFESRHPYHLLADRTGMDSPLTAALEVRNLSPALGAAITGIDLRRDLNPATVAALLQAWHRHLVLVFPGQALAEADQIRIAEHFGEIQGRSRPEATRREAGRTSHPGVMLVSNIRENGEPIGSLPDGEMQFHSDMCYTENPVKGTFLYAIEVPSAGGDTLFLNMYSAYDGLPEAMKARLAGLRALNSYSHGYSGATLRSANQRLPEDRHFTHPVVRTHPDTGRQALYINRLMTMEIEGLPEAESAALLEELFTHIEQERFIYAHNWRAGDLVLWDNRCTLHARTDFSAGERRLLRRVVIKGDRPV